MSYNIKLSSLGPRSFSSSDDIETAPARPKRSCRTPELTSISDSTEPVENPSHFSSNSIPVLSEKLLTSIYSRLEILGNKMADDFNSMVVSVVDLTQSQTKHAVKITLNAPPLALIKTLEKCCNTAMFPHLTQTKLLGKIRVKPGAFLKTESNAGFVIEAKAHHKERWAYVYEMELMEGDLKTLRSKKLSTKELAVIEVQRIASEAFLYSIGIIPSDLKDINVLFRALTDKDEFNGKPSLKVDFLKYRIGKSDYFLPQIPYLIKLCDYDEWSQEPNNLPAIDFEKVMSERFKNNSEILAELEGFKIKPTIPCRIAHMN